MLIFFVCLIQFNIIIFLQSCESEEDGLFAFDMHSDGEGQRYL